MSAPYTPETSLRLHDEAIYAWLGGLHVDYSPDTGSAWTQRENVPIIRIRTTPDRIFADTVDQLVSQGYFKDEASAEMMRANAEANFTVLPLPLVTWQRGDPEPSQQLASAVKEPIRYIDPTTGKWVRVPWPGHYLTPYTLTFWCFKQYTEDHIREWLMGQMGNPGAGNFETYIPVIHPAPWGTINQSLSLRGTADQSRLEGREIRYKRFAATVVLRTWVMKYPVQEYNVEKSSVIVASLPYNSADPRAAPAPTGQDSSSQYTGNLFSIAPLTENNFFDKWYVTGNASAAIGRIAPARPPSIDPQGSLAFAVKDTTDTADIGEWFTNLDGNELSIFSVSFDYVGLYSTVSLCAAQHTATTARAAIYVQTLPLLLQWNPVQQFVLFTQALGALYVAGTGEAAKVWLSRISVRRIFTMENPFAPNAIGSTFAEWTQLKPQPYLCVAVISAFNPSDTVSLDDDASSPVYTRSLALSSGAVGVVLLSQPVSNSLKLRWPSTVTVANVFVQPYDAGYRGSVV